jgi:preprotein translocase subunit Sec61beta
MDEGFFEYLSQFIQSILQLDPTGILMIIIALGIIVVILKILSKISKIIQIILIIGIIILIIIWISKLNLV